MIESAFFWKIVVIMTIGTFMIRYSIIGLAAKVKISHRWKELFSFIPAAIIPALAVPMVFFHQGHAEWVFGKERFLILAVSVLVCRWTKSTLFTVLFGLTALYLLTQI